MYLRNDLEWDLISYLSKVSGNSARIFEKINQFLDCLDGIKAAQSELPEGVELIEEIEIPDELGARFAEAMDNLQNEIFYNSLFVITTSYLEYSIVEISRIIGPYLSNPVPYLQYKKGNGLEKAKNYLKETLSIDLAQNGKWNSIQTNNKIRNLIMHNDGNIIKDYERELKDQPDYQILKASKFLHISESGYIYIKDANFIRDTLKSEVEFIHEVYNDVVRVLKAPTTS